MKVLVDSSIWIDHFRAKSPTLSGLLKENLVTIHDLIILELAVGNLKKHQRQTLFDIGLFDRVLQATQSELLSFINTEKLMGHGLSVVDVALLWSALTSQCELWTRDKKLKSFCKKYGCDFDAR